MQILQPSDLQLACLLLQQGEVVGVPTETVYGLAGSATNPTAIAKIFAAKERPFFDPLIVHLAPDEPIDAFAKPGPAQRATLDSISVFWPGPLTVVLPKADDVQPLITAGLPTVAIRRPSHPLFQQILTAVGPLAAPSANRFGRISPTQAQAVYDELNQVVPAVVDGGPCAVGVESTIVSIEEDGTLTLLRPGAITEDALAQFATVHPHQATPSAIQAPGQLESHYAPTIPAHLVTIDDNWDTTFQSTSQHQTVALLYVSGEARRPAGWGQGPTVTLTTTEDPVQAASRLFGVMRQMQDQADVLVVIGHQGPGLFVAIADRLRRACA